MAQFDKDGFKFDLETQRFIKNRWETDLGAAVLEEIVEGIKSSSEVRGILDRYVLDHPENSDPYGHPIYPRSEMKDGAFWVISQDDLRGIAVYNESFEGSRSLEKKHLSYARFFGCNFNRVNLECSEFSYARFDKCNLAHSIFAISGGFNAQFVDCDLKKACFFDCFMGYCDLSGSDLRDAYFEDARLHGLKVNHLTNFGERIASGWSKRKIPDDQKPDIYRSIRLAYEEAEIWDTMDVFLAAEQESRRKGLLWPAFKKSKSLTTFSKWFGSWCRGTYSNYATNPWRAVFVTALIPVLFALVYLAAGLPNAAGSSTSNANQSIGQSLYFSFTTFTTLGYGDVTYSADRPFLRFLSTPEAFIGAVSMALLVVVFARKVIR